MTNQNNEVAEFIYRTKYLQEGETFHEGMTRIAGALQDNEEHFREFRDILLDQRFLPAGRIQVAVGATRSTTPYNCYVSGTIEDSMEGIHKRLGEALQTMRLGGGIGYDFCLSPGTRVLTTDMRWWNVENLQEGDKVVGFPEDFNVQKSTYQEATIVSNRKITQPVYLIKTDKGDIKCSANHLFVARTKRENKKKGDEFRWIAAEDLKVDNQIAFTIKPWDRDNSYEEGWLAGILDGEGWSTKTNVGVCQNEGPVLDKIRGALDKIGINYRERVRDNGKNHLVQLICKGKWEALKLLSITRPERLYYEWRGKKLCGKSSLPATIRSIHYVGEEEVYAVATTTKTLVANGFLSHNSTLRPSGERIVSLSSSSCGPVGDAHRSRGFMDLFDAGCSVISSAGHRRGAQMAVLRVDHPDIRHFIRAKRQAGRLTNFNVSVGITDEFMEAVKEDKEFDLRFCGKVYETIRARNLWDEIMRGTWDFAEPGVLFLDTINRKNNLWYCETIAATNPCGEQPLPPYGACLLGSFNLTKYITPHYYVDRINEYGGPEHQDGWDFDWDRFIEDIPVVVRSMDNVIDNAIYPLPEQEEEAKNKRRMGLGITGLANTAEVLGWPYGSKEMLAFTETVMKTLRDEAYMSSVELAKEKGPFPLFDKEEYLGYGILDEEYMHFAMHLPLEILQEINSHGIRNSHLLSIAPTGTISLAAGNISSGIEPPYSLGYYTRNVFNPDGSVAQFKLMDYAESEYGVAGVTSQDCKLTDHVEVLNLCSAFVDSSVSKTCNVGPEITFNEFKEVYMQAYEGGASGITTFRPVEYGGKREGIFSSDKEEGAQCTIDEMGNRSCDV